MEQLVSIVVPVYKVEEYLDRCVRSLLSQTYQNIEILLIDDGSPDNSGAICDAWAEKDSRIRVFHKKNGGLSDARNYGMARTTGKFVTYVDSDDFVAECFVERMMTLQQKYQADVICCDFTQTCSDNAEYTTAAQVEVYDNRQACFALMGSRYIPLVIACCKLYRREIVEAYPFPVGKLHEDEATTCKFLYAARTVVLCEDKLYAYYQNPNSITRDGKTTNYGAKLWALSARAIYFDSIPDRELANVSWSMNVRHLIDEALRNGYSLKKIVYPYIRENQLVTRLNMKTWVKLIGAVVAPNAVKRNVSKRQTKLR